MSWSWNMNQMVIKGVDSQTFMAANLGRVENFQGFSGPPGSQTDGTQSQPTSSGYHLQLSKFYLRAAAWSRRHNWRRPSRSPAATFQPLLWASLADPPTSCRLTETLSPN